MELNILEQIQEFLINNWKIILFKSLGSIFLFFIILKLVKKFIKRFKNRLIQNYQYTNPYIFKIVNLTGNILFTIGIITDIMIVLAFLGFNTGLILGGISMALGFGLQEMIKNFVSGLLFINNPKIKIGDFVEILGKYNVKGTIEEITLRYTKLRVLDKTLLMIPNSHMIKTPVKTIKAEKAIRNEIIIPLPRYVNLEKLKIDLINELKTYPFIILKQHLTAYLSAFSDKGFDLKIIFFRDPNGEKGFFEIKTDLRKIILEFLKKNGIKIPYKKIMILQGE